MAGLLAASFGVMLAVAPAAPPSAAPNNAESEATATGAAESGGDDGVHLGAGWAVAAQTAEQTRPTPTAAQPAKAPGPLASLPTAGIRPARTLDMVRETRRARAMAIGAAVAVQGAMIVYGIMRMLDQRDEARALAAQEPEPFNPYPR